MPSHNERYDVLVFIGDARKKGDLNMNIKTKSIITLVLSLALLLMSLSSVQGYVRTDAWECTSHGEESQGDSHGVVPTSSDAYTSTGVCRKTCCILCISPSPFTDCWSGSAKTPCQCNSGGTFDSIPPVITLFTPQDGVVYKTHDVFINVSTDEPTQYIKRLTEFEPLRTMCTNCQSSNFLLHGVDDGIHNMTITAADLSNNIAKITHTFIVDTLPPEILSTRPSFGGFVKRSGTEFSVTYNENNVLSTTMFYRKKGTGSYSSVGFSCASGMGKSCKQLVDLSAFNEGDIIEYYFMTSDSFGSDTSGVNEVTIDTALANEPFNIISPHDGQAYPSTKVTLHVLAFFTASKIKYSTDGVKFTDICSACTEVSKSLSVKDGQSTITVIVTDEGGSDYQQVVHFSVDSKPPSIKTTLPNDKSTSKGTFSITYDEDKLEGVNLHYWGPGETSHHITPLAGCTSGKIQTCSKTLDMSSYNGKIISYEFELKDSANTVMSKVTNTTIDTVNPIITLVTPLTNSIITDPNVPFNITLDGQVENLELFDNANKPKSLCKNCNGYKKNVGFMDGHHDVKIKATDFGGNVNEKTISFTVDSRLPKVSSVIPSGFTRGSFDLKYSEDNVELVKMYYKRTTEGSYTSSDFTICPSGSNQICTLTLDLGAYDGQRINYYVAIEDVAGNIASSKVMENVMVDATTPALTVNNPVNTAYITRVPFDVQVNEMVASIDAFDNGVRSSLCTKCTTVVKEKTFQKGSHTLIIKATDFAGNTAQQTKTFIVN